MKEENTQEYTLDFFTILEYKKRIDTISQNMRNNNIGRDCLIRGDSLEEIISEYIPGFERASPEENKRGTDLIYKDGSKYQVKCDQRIPETENLYFEKYKKTIGQEAGPWRNSLMDADYYIIGYLVDGFDKNNKPKSKHIVFYEVSITDYNKTKEELNIARIKPTSKGYLININKIPHKKYEFPINNNITQLER